MIAPSARSSTSLPGAAPRGPSSPRRDNAGDAPGTAGSDAEARRRPDAVRSTAYGGPFWFSYLSNLAFMIAISLLFRYADFVRYLGGSELSLGWIVGVGMIGSLVMRGAQGVGIDVYGPRRVWLWSCALLTVACLAHLAVTTTDGPLVYVLRIAYNCAIAGVFGASVTYIGSRAPVERMAEVIGTLGTSGFLGMVLGTALGDRVFGTGPTTLAALRMMFILAGGLAGAGLAAAWVATRGEAPRPRRRHVSTLRVLARYHPGAVLVVSAATGFGLALPGIFLAPYAASLGLGGIAVFFAVYAPTAFAARIMTRRLHVRLGNRAMMLVGLAALTAGIALFTVAVNQWLLALPAILIAVGHAVLFPAVIAAGSSAFPARYRGLATTLVLAMFDVGTLVGSPLAGAMLYYAHRGGLPPFPTMFVGVAGLILAAALVYAWFGDDRPNRRTLPRGRLEAVAGDA